MRAGNTSRCPEHELWSAIRGMHARRQTGNRSRREPAHVTCTQACTRTSKGQHRHRRTWGARVQRTAAATAHMQRRDSCNLAHLPTQRPCQIMPNRITDPYKICKHMHMCVCTDMRAERSYCRRSSCRRRALPRLFPHAKAPLGLCLPLFRFPKFASDRSYIEHEPA